MATQPFASSPQDEILLDGVARRITTDVHQFYSTERIEEAAVHEERARLARELHDGILQSLTGVALELRALTRLVAEDPRMAQKCLRDVENLIVDEQGKLRTWVQELRASPPTAIATAAEISTALDELRRRAEMQWRLRIRLDVASHGSVPRTLSDEIYRIVQEGLSNIGRHARARNGHIEVRVLFDRVHIVIGDDGVGFPFHGRYDLATLADQRQGPKSLVERVGALRGQLILTSSSSGSRIEIDLPLQGKPGLRPAPRARAA
jgi:signal transduction histidine kinase